jgi:FAD/FMN-containing dehydrogenase
VRPLRDLCPVIDTVSERPYTEIDEVHQDPEQPIPALELNSLMGELDEAFVQRLMTVAGPGVATPPTIVECRLLGGALARPPARPSAIGHRATPYSLLFAGIAAPGQVEPMLAVLHHAREAVSAWSTGKAFPNFLGGSGHGDPARVRTAYEPDDYERLRRIKAAYDPDNVFRLNHNIAPAED